MWLPECRLLAENTTLAVIFNADLGTLEDAQKAIEPSDNMVAAFARTLVADGRFIRKSTARSRASSAPGLSIRSTAGSTIFRASKSSFA